MINDIFVTFVFIMFIWVNKRINDIPTLKEYEYMEKEKNRYYKLLKYLYNDCHVSNDISHKVFQKVRDVLIEKADL